MAILSLYCETEPSTQLHLLQLQQTALKMALLSASGDIFANNLVFVSCIINNKCKLYLRAKLKTQEKIREIRKEERSEKTVLQTPCLFTRSVVVAYAFFSCENPEITGVTSIGESKITKIKTRWNKYSQA